MAGIPLNYLSTFWGEAHNICLALGMFAFALAACSLAAPTATEETTLRLPVIMPIKVSVWRCKAA